MELGSLLKVVSGRDYFLIYKVPTTALEPIQSKNITFYDPFFDNELVKIHLDW